MAFDVTNLSVVNIGSGQTIYAYSTEDTINTVTADNTYFGAALDGTDGTMRQGDIILGVFVTGGTHVPAMLIVEAVSTGEVTTRSTSD